MTRKIIAAKADDVAALKGKNKTTPRRGDKPHRNAYQTDFADVTVRCHVETLNGQGGTDQIMY